MKDAIHPKVHEITINCACGSTVHTRSTIAESFTVDICSECHPFFTGKKKFIDSAGKVEKFQRKYGDVMKNRPKKGSAKH